MTIIVTTEANTLLFDDQPKAVAPPKDLVDIPFHKDRDIRQLVKKHFKNALVESRGECIAPKGRPYLEEFDVVQYTKGFVAPSFHTIGGNGEPHQHLAYIRFNYYNITNNNGLLVRLYMNSLIGMEYDWYASLPNSYVKTFLCLNTC